MHVCVPRNMVQAVGMYNTLLEGMDPAIVVECLNGYRLKEKLPSNLLDYRVALGNPEIIREGSDITIVSYGSTLRIIAEAAEILSELDIDCEIVDVQTLLPFDIHHQILGSLKKTNRIIFIDEDVPGGATAYMFKKVMEEQGGYRWLDTAPRTLYRKSAQTGLCQRRRLFQQTKYGRDHRCDSGHHEGIRLRGKMQEALSFKY